MSTELRDDTYWMNRACELAERALAADEVPVGAVIVRDNTVIGEGYNHPISGSDPTAHAEIAALRDAAQRERNYRLPGSTLYVTVEPCTMCFGALVHARIDRLVYGAPEPKAGVISSQLNLPKQPFYNHRIECEGGVLEARCAELMSGFFAQRRSR